MLQPVTNPPSRSTLWCPLLLYGSRCHRSKQPALTLAHQNSVQSTMDHLRRQRTHRSRSPALRLAHQNLIQSAMDYLRSRVRTGPYHFSSQIRRKSANSNHLFGQKYQAMLKELLQDRIAAVSHRHHGGTTLTRVHVYPRPCTGNCTGKNSYRGNRLHTKPNATCLAG